MTLRAFLNKIILGKKTVNKATIVSKGKRAPVPSTFQLENLKVTRRRTEAEIKLAYKEGRFAEMTPHQAGM